MRGSIILVFAAALAGCAHKLAENTDSMAAYLAFSRALKAGENIVWSRHLAARIDEDFKRAPDDVARQGILRQVAYPHWLDKVDEHFSKATPGGSCLTVNGLDKSGEPASVSVRYVAENHVLKAEEFHYQLVESRDQLPTKPMCPAEVVVSFP